eukprot:g14586.t1
MASRSREVKVEQEKELITAQQELERLTATLEQAAKEGRHVAMQQAQVEEETRRVEQENAEREESIKVKQRTLELLPDAENNLVKLQ